MTKAARRLPTLVFPLALIGAACADFSARTAGTGGASGTVGGTGGVATGGGTGAGTGGRPGTGGTTAGSGGAVAGTGGRVGAGGGPGTIMRVDLTGKKVLFIVGSPTSPATGDMSFQGVLTDRGMIVTLADAETADANAATMNLIVGSDTAGSGWPTLYKDIAVPMIAFGNAFDFALGFIPTNSAKGSISTPVMLTIVDETTPLAAAFTTGMNVGVIGTTRNTSIYWATPGGSPINVASVMGAPTQMGVFAFEKGAMMAIGTAAARRVVLGWRTDFVTTDLAIEAFRMMNAAIEWTATAP
jgi:hypothetical protein